MLCLLQQLLKGLVLVMALGGGTLWAQAITWREVVHEQKASFYKKPEALRVADNLLLFQAAAGGWDKIDSRRNSRDMVNVLSAERKRQLLKDKGHRCSLDNEATYSQMRFLARVYAATGEGKYKEGFLKGVGYLLRAQYQNGGWPQFYPLLGSYHDRITFNDHAMIGAAWMLSDVAAGRKPFDLAGKVLREKCRVATEKAIACILTCQLVAAGKKTAWAQQYDEESMKSVPARVSELPSIAVPESAEILRFLMHIDNPSAEVKVAVKGAVGWLEKVKVVGRKVITVKDDRLPGGIDKRLVPAPGSAPIWGRYYEIGTDRVMYIEQGVVHYSLAELSHKHRVGHAWIGGRWPAVPLQDYAGWRVKWHSANPLPATE
ncbi:MAG: pectate lyase [Verrucomicrobiaceae bacterium]|nr:pectate lyase [Verrucomicrobiaceae bacterium]